jgi:hypothetical protein
MLLIYQIRPKLHNLMMSKLHCGQEGRAPAAVMADEKEKRISRAV